MTQIRVLTLAYDAALDRWGREYDRLKADPDNEITQHRERRSWEELQEVQHLLKAAEKEKSPC